MPNGTRTTTMEGVCTTKAFSVTRRLFTILLDWLRLQAFWCACRADGSGSEVDGSAPLKSRLDRHGGEAQVTSVPRSSLEVAPVQKSLREDRLIA